MFHFWLCHSELYQGSVITKYELIRLLYGTDVKFIEDTLTFDTFNVNFINTSTSS